LKDIDFVHVLQKLGGTLLENKSLSAFDFYKKGLLIKDKDGIEYTVSKVVKQSGKDPYVICYMYRKSPDGNFTKVYSRIPSVDANGKKIKIEDFEVV